MTKSPTRILFDPGPHGRIRTRLGTEGGTDRVIFQTGGHLRWYLSIRPARTLRLRTFGRKPWFGWSR